MVWINYFGALRALTPPLIWEFAVSCASPPFRYVDEVVREAPWALDDDFLTRHKIDFVAHDDVPYTIGAGTCIYAALKKVSM